MAFSVVKATFAAGRIFVQYGFGKRGFKAISTPLPRSGHIGNIKSASHAHRRRGCGRRIGHYIIRDLLEAGHWRRRPRRFVRAILCAGRPLALPGPTFCPGDQNRGLLAQHHLEEEA